MFRLPPFNMSVYLLSLVYIYCTLANKKRTVTQDPSYTHYTQRFYYIGKIMIQLLLGIKYIIRLLSTIVLNMIL